MPWYRSPVSVSIVTAIEDEVVKALEAGVKLPRDITLNLDGLEHCGLTRFFIKMKVGKHVVRAGAGLPEKPFAFH